MRKAGKIGDAKWQTIKEAIVATRSARRDLKAARERGVSPMRLDWYLNTFLTAANKVITYREEFNDA
jgi:hypothetical protein